MFMPLPLYASGRQPSLIYVPPIEAFASAPEKALAPVSSCGTSSATTSLESPTDFRAAVTETSTSTNSLDFPILKLDPAEFVRVTKAQYHKQLQRYRTMCEQEEQRRTTGSVASETPRAGAGGTAPGAEQSTLPRRSEPYSHPREFFRSDAAFVEDALRRFVVSDADCVDYEKRTWHRRCRGCCTAPDSSSSNDLHHE